MSSEDLQKYDQLDEMGKLEKPAKTYEKLRLQFKNKQLQYSLLLDKYERSTKKIMQLQEVIRDHRLSDLKLKYKSQIEMMECQRKEDQQRIETFREQVRTVRKEMILQQQEVERKAIMIQQLEERLGSIQDCFEKDDKMKELQDTVIKLCNKHLSQRYEDLSVPERKLLQAVFGDSMLLSNQLRQQMVSYRELIEFLLNQVVIKIFQCLENDKASKYRQSTINQKQISLLNQTITSQS